MKEVEDYVSGEELEAVKGNWSRSKGRKRRNGRQREGNERVSGK